MYDLRDLLLRNLRTVIDPFHEQIQNAGIMEIGGVIPDRIR